MCVLLVPLVSLLLLLPSQSQHHHPSDRRRLTLVGINRCFPPRCLSPFFFPDRFPCWFWAFCRHESTTSHPLPINCFPSIFHSCFTTDVFFPSLVHSKSLFPCCLIRSPLNEYEPYLRYQPQHKSLRLVPDFPSIGPEPLPLVPLDIVVC